MHRIVKKQLFGLNQLGVRLTPVLKLKDKDLSDCMHLRPAANKKLVNVLRKGVRFQF